ncbi:hypothetical protein [Spiribacter onubensis]|uniref:Uncharacterized protein n=1 Tax=Spiribacter onubensis TaxID=3122420 RepID=A0ABV3S7D3_9GAMM
MEGIIESVMVDEVGARPQKAPPQGGRQQPPPQSAPDDTVNMNPEMAGEQVNALINSMLGELYGAQLEKAANVLDKMQGRPEKGIGTIVAGLMGAAHKTLRDQGKSVPPGVLFQAGMIAAQAVGEMAERMGVINPENDDEIIEAAFMVGLGDFGKANGNEMSPQERQRYAELIDGMEEGKRIAMANAEAGNGGAKPGGVEEVSEEIIMAGGAS